MRHQRTSVTIAAPPEAVFDLYADPERRSEWNPSARGVEVIGELNQPGSRYIVDTRFGKFEVHMLRIERPRLVEIVEGVGSPGEVRVTMRFKPAPEGTRVIIDSVFDHHGRLRWLTESGAALMGRAYSRIELRRFKRAAERRMPAGEPTA
jgi:uncharacterized protein YndB with AHSA1/START domain